MAGAPGAGGGEDVAGNRPVELPHIRRNRASAGWAATRRAWRELQGRGEIDGEQAAKRAQMATGLGDCREEDGEVGAEEEMLQLAGAADNVPAAEVDQPAAAARNTRAGCRRAGGIRDRTGGTGLAGARGARAGQLALLPQLMQAIDQTDGAADTVP